jgi:acetyltransferase-like isoleucine patch superfamily enzyme
VRRHQARPRRHDRTLCGVRAGRDRRGRRGDPLLLPSRRRPCRARRAGRPIRATAAGRAARRRRPYRQFRRDQGGPACGRRQGGNFVEIKEARLAAGAKANHLAYIGDASVGAAANIGAGTITCNYDGHDKHRTEIGDGAFIGSNSALVAPVKIGERAYIGSGSVITRDVPADALALGRARQSVKEGWAARLRAMLGTGKKAP